MTPTRELQKPAGHGVHVAGVELAQDHDLSEGSWTSAALGGPKNPAAHGQGENVVLESTGVGAAERFENRCRGGATSDASAAAAGAKVES